MSETGEVTDTILTDAVIRGASQMSTGGRNDGDAITQVESLNGKISFSAPPDGVGVGGLVGQP